MFFIPSSGTNFVLNWRAVAAASHVILHIHLHVAETTWTDPRVRQPGSFDNPGTTYPPSGQPSNRPDVWRSTGPFHAANFRPTTITTSFIFLLFLLLLIIIIFTFGHGNSCTDHQQRHAEPSSRRYAGSPRGNSHNRGIPSYFWR